eukprot:548981-Hanusia_phi.AAC.2
MPLTFLDVNVVSGAAEEAEWLDVLVGRFLPPSPSVSDVFRICLLAHTPDHRLHATTGCKVTRGV